MKRLLIILLLCSNVCFAQYKYKNPYRPAPRIGEAISVIGVSLLGASYIGAFGHETKTATTTKVIGYSMIGIGVYIDINSDKIRYKYKRKSRCGVKVLGIKIKL